MAEELVDSTGVEVVGDSSRLRLSFADRTVGGVDMAPEPLYDEARRIDAASTTG